VSNNVELVQAQEARAAAGVVSGLLAEPAPAVSFDPGFLESGLGLTVVCHVREFVDQFPVRNELRKRIFARLRSEAISMPFPTRTVYVRQQGA
jgi:small-conductance mechanosensitive channel